MGFGKLAHKLLLRLDPERAHTIGKWAMKHKLGAPGIYQSGHQHNIQGVSINNPLGLAAGFDKNGELVNQAPKYGFGWVEVGSVTFHGGPGKPKPRLFRLPNDGLLNRMGLNGEPAEQVMERLNGANHPFAINITKTNDPSIMGDDGIADVVRTHRLARDLPADKLLYTVTNLSCPNSDGKTLEDPENLGKLLPEIKKVRNSLVPHFIKISPGQNPNSLRTLVEVADGKVDGYVCSNTLLKTYDKIGQGGESGPNLEKPLRATLSIMRGLTRKTLIACGGISSGEDMLAAEQSGANFFQAYTGFVLGKNAGPDFAHTLNKEYEALK